MKYFIFILSITVSGLFSGCDYFTSHCNVTIIIPPPPLFLQETYPDLSVKLTVFNSQVQTSETLLPIPFEQKTILVEKSEYAYIRAEWYANKVPLGFSSLGEVYGRSDGFDTKEIKLSYEGGFAAERCISCIQKGYDITGFNAGRLIELLKKRKVNPWEYDSSRIEQDIANRVFNSFSLKRLEKKDQWITLESGVWFLENPFYPEIPSDGINEALLPELTHGYHILSQKLTGKRIEILTDEFGVIALTP